MTNSRESERSFKGNCSCSASCSDLAKLADGKTIRYLNVNDQLASKDSKLLEGITEDRLHLSLKGYQVWADALKLMLTDLQGPPAKEDHAPPPTGDPSAAKRKS